MRTRSAGIIIHNGKILLIRRRLAGKEYLVFPGGGVEEKETKEEACTRELLEETSIKVTVGSLFCKQTWDSGDDTYLYICEYISGEPHLDLNAPEIEGMKDGTQYYNPEWVDISLLPKTLLYPLEIRDPLIDALKNGFQNEPLEIFIKITERRQSI